ncbi:ADP-ribose pyrophosphatase YjhB, NUDIX family [Paramicrobacterium humi]|uniref:ADP-ribose pyrophosphatase YjhB, NUDIX family n=1 Tax=Paramicrobacterium humi TaxID=640635 RepID=A0A1H4KNL4_9MICO|nr:CoA pyrophosphatase [Microbacterium humi]SEB59846.1 ADP-ribose pyrophosphatase YjhB, NUDIX family [Microbacterium humi]
MASVDSRDGVGARAARDELERLCEREVDWRRGPLGAVPDADTARAAAILILFGVLDDAPASARDTPVARDLDVLLQRRADTLRSHPGQISFPGGGIEPADAGPIEAALREAHEETGLDPAGVDVLGVLPEVPLAVSNHLVTPIVAWWSRPSRVAAVDHAETVEVFRMPVADLLDPANRVTTVRRYGSRTFRGPAFLVRDTLVWGFTAILLSRMFDELDWTLPWDAARELEI